MSENRIYVDGELVNICYNEYALFCNYTNYVQRYGAERVSLKRLNEVVKDEEKLNWLERLE